MSNGAKRARIVGVDVDVDSFTRLFIHNKTQINLIGRCIRLAGLMKTASRVDAVN